MAITSFKQMMEKGKTFRKTKWIDTMEGFPRLPLKTLSAMEEMDSFESLNYIKPPKKERKMTEEERQEFLKSGTNVSETMLKMFRVAEYDKTDPDYLAKLEESKKLQVLFNAVRYIDLNEQVEAKRNNDKVWQDLGLKDENDYLGLIDVLFNQLKLPSTFVQDLHVAIKALQGDTVFSKIEQLSTLYKDGDTFEMINDLVKYKKQELENAKSKSQS